MPAIAKRPKMKSTAPLLPMLELPPHTGLSKDNQAAVDAYLDAARELSGTIAALHDRRAELLATAGGRTVDELTADGADLAAERVAAQESLQRLLWRRRELIQAILPDVAAAESQAKADYELEIEKERKMLEQSGVGPESMPAGRNGANPRAAAQQFDHYVAQREPVLAMKGEWHRRRVEAEQIRGMTAGVVTARQFTIAWETPADGRQTLVAKLAGIDV